MIELDGYAKSHDMTLEKAIEDYVGFKHRKSYYRLINLFDELEEERNSKPNRVLNQLVHKLGYRSYIETKSNTTQDAYNRLEALDRLLEMSRKYPTIDAFLAQIEIIKSTIQIDSSDKSDTSRSPYNSLNTHTHNPTYPKPLTPTSDSNNSRLRHSSSKVIWIPT